MAQKGGNRQQKQAAKAVRRRQAVAAKQRAERAASTPSARIAAAAESPVDRCLRTADTQASGIGHVILAKRLPSGTLGCAFFLVDLLCLGVKDVYYREVAPSDLDERVAELVAGGQAMVAIDPASAKALILGAVTFAADCGMDPAEDYRRVIRLFDGVDASAATERFTFGRDGMPVYIPGPNDGAAKIREIERRLTRARGPDGWDVDPMAGLSERQRLTMHGMFDLLGRQAGRNEEDEGGLVIDHEGPAEPQGD